ncbi:MAG TPA: HPr family phosphocarrier protein [Thermoanaerobaculia bacterium]|jgi:phosphocarrier protein|nr:HPr family phosphocarrier protein [Thermoanaerobaculia bacterium]
MIECKTEIVNRLGLHARAAAKLVHTAGAYQSRVTVEKDGEEVDAKSILGVLLLAASQGTTIKVRCDGQDEEAALRAVTDLIANRFDEES